MLSSSLPTFQPASMSQSRVAPQAPAGSATDNARSSASEARSTAASALNNPRFGQMLDQIMSPQASGMVAFMKQDSTSGGTDLKSASAAYFDND